MTRPIRIRGVRRKQIDEEKLALAFLLLAKQLNDERNAASADQAHDGAAADAATEPEAA